MAAIRRVCNISHTKNEAEVCLICSIELNFTISSFHNINITLLLCKLTYYSMIFYAIITLFLQLLLYKIQLYKLRISSHAKSTNYIMFVINVGRVFYNSFNYFRIEPNANSFEPKVNVKW